MDKDSNFGNPQVALAEISALLHGLREFVELPPAEVQPAFENAINASGDRSLKGLTVTKFEQKRAGARSKRRQRVYVALENCYRICRAYRVPPLIADPLCSNVAETDWVKVVRSSFFQPNTQIQNTRIDGELGGVPSRGSNCTYSIPDFRLPGIDTAILRLEIGSGGSTDPHCHSGDELVFVLEGAATLRFKNTGVAVQIGKHDIAHFAADEAHCLECAEGQRFDALIIRFYQIAPEGTRTKAIREVREVLRNNNNKQLDPLIRPYIKQLFRAPSDDEAMWDWKTTSSPQLKVRDSFGMGLMLRHQEQSGNHDLKRDKVAFRAAGHTWKGFKNVTPATVQKILDGEDYQVPFDDVESLSQAFGIATPLFSTFFFPAVLRLCLVDHDTDLFSMEMKEARYLVPHRHLAGSDTSVVFVELESRDSGTVTNKHSGIEILVPMEGKIRVEFEHSDNGCVEIDASECPGFIAFRSNISHRVVNAGDIPAKALVVRYYDSALA